ncbi:MAG TPA: glycoside hydrolase family 9 protein [Solirubrobacteraceae bacterium]|jgi:endoglucanase|nr:glycoside hydrolase family 9 protein [Solirubrobacteraceae bacterium]
MRGCTTIVLGALLAGAALIVGAAPASAGQEAFVRVNQVGYGALAPKRAYLMSNFDETGAPFAVKDEGGSTVLTGTVGQPAGSWSKAFPDVYPLDFDGVQVPGRYTLTVAGVSSPPFQIAEPNALYSPAIANALSFYETERDGPQYVPSALRSAPAHLNDANATVYSTPKVNSRGVFKGDLHSLGTSIDASGGWWDAGDYLKFVETTSYTVEEMLAGVRDFPALMGAASPPSQDFTGEARFGLEWLLRMFDEQTGTLYYQVGIGEGNPATAGDHDIWRLPQADDGYGGEDPRYRYIRRRPVFRAGPPGAPVSPNLAGRDAAAFGLCFQVFHESEPALAERCLRAGERIFELADTKPHGRLLTAIPFGFYPEREWRDDLELGATELALALSSSPALPSGLPHTDPGFYLESAAGWAKEYIKHARGRSETLNLYDVSGLAHYELVRALRADGSPAGLAVGEAGLLANLRAQLQSAQSQAAGDPFGFGFPWAAADTASHGDGLAVMAAEYDELTGETTFAAEGARWLANVLGANAWGVSMAIGDGSVFPDCPSHQVANLAGSLDGSPPVLAGGVVEGPSNAASSGEVEGMRPCPAGGGDQYARFDGSGAVFEDNVQSFTTAEPAIDLTASSMLAFSWQAGAPVALP